MLRALEIVKNKKTLAATLTPSLSSDCSLRRLLSLTEHLMCPSCPPVSLRGRVDTKLFPLLP